MTLEKRLTIGLFSIAALLVIGSTLFLANGGRIAVLIIVATGILYGALRFYIKNRHTQALAATAQELGLELIKDMAAEKGNPDLAYFRRTLDNQTYHWRIAGSFPFLTGKINGEIVTIRVPEGVDFDTAAPNSTRIAVHKRSKLGRIFIYSKEFKENAPRKEFLLTDPEFNRHFYVTGPNRDIVEEIISEDAQAALAAIGPYACRGIEVNRYGVYLHADGIITEPEEMSSRLNAVSLIASNIQETEKGL